MSRFWVSVTFATLLIGASAAVAQSIFEDKWPAPATSTAPAPSTRSAASQAATKREPHPIETKLDTMPKNLWPETKETEIRSTERAKWLKNLAKVDTPYEFVGRITNVRVEKVYRAPPAPAGGAPAGARAGRALAPPGRGTQVDLVKIEVQLDPLTFWGSEHAVTMEVSLPSVSAATASKWNTGDAMTINCRITAFSTDYGQDLELIAEGRAAPKK